MPLNKYACHISFVCSTALILWSTCRPHITSQIRKKKQYNCNFWLPCYYHICANNKYSLKCNIYKLLHVHIWDIYVSIYTSYGLIAIKHVTRSTGIYTFHITGICPWTNMPATLHMCPITFLLQSTYIPLITPNIHQKSINCNLYLPSYCIISANNKYAP